MPNIGSHSTVYLNTPEAIRTHVERYWGAPGSGGIVHRFVKNVENVRIKIGQAGQEVFQHSFDLERFNSDGSVKWKKLSEKTTVPKRSANLGKTKARHPILQYSGSLKRSITYVVDKSHDGLKNTMALIEKKGSVTKGIHMSNYELNGERYYGNKMDYTVSSDNSWGLGRKGYGMKSSVRYPTFVKSFYNHVGGLVRIWTNPRMFKPSGKHKKRRCYAAVHNAGFVNGGYYYGASKKPAIQRQFMGHSSVFNKRLYELGSEIFEGFA